jgi:FAD:protein FMN transferase
MADQDTPPEVVRRRHDAMATSFELRLAGVDADYAGRAATEAFRLVDRMENLLSRFREDSEISRIGRLRDGDAMRVSPETFDCLRIALALNESTGGAFDPALGHWREPDSVTPGAPGPRGRLTLYPEGFTVVCDGGCVRPDLGAIGKGYALDLIATLLADWEISQALLIAGGSSLLALDGPTPGTGWEVTLTATQSFHLRRLAVGASGAAVKGVHILDPRDGTPCHRYARTWAVAGSAAEADALSTACMLLDPGQIAAVCARHPQAGAALLPDDNRPEELLFLGDFPTVSGARIQPLNTQFP